MRSGSIGQKRLDANGRFTAEYAESAEEEEEQKQKLATDYTDQHG
jgi:hypothetical protein